MLMPFVAATFFRYSPVSVLHSARPHGRIPRLQVIEPSGDESLLLAIDRVQRSPKQGWFASEDHGGEHRANCGYITSQKYEPLDLALAEWTWQSLYSA